MLAIRLQRIGKKNRPSYRVVISESSRDLYGKHNEILGNYDPVATPKTVNLKADRIKYWMSVGAKPSATVHNLLVSQGVVEGKKIQAWKPKNKKEPRARPKAAPQGTEKPTA
ncbi:MAG: 30S ribosomal protein S16 [Parcubacteria group bacterium]|nr:30S ribosomal protein S16 [Parcubacteria group bacterium]